jgi:hypothetical protein
MLGKITLYPPPPPPPLPPKSLGRFSIRPLIFQFLQCTPQTSKFLPKPPLNFFFFFYFFNLGWGYFGKQKKKKKKEVKCSNCKNLEA